VLLIRAPWAASRWLNEEKRERERGDNIFFVRKIYSHTYIVIGPVKIVIVDSSDVLDQVFHDGIYSFHIWANPIVFVDFRYDEQGKTVTCLRR
jgi:hypothetical protein